MKHFVLGVACGLTLALALVALARLATPRPQVAIFASQTPLNLQQATLSGGLDLPGVLHISK